MKLLKDFTSSAISMIKKNADDFGKMMKDFDFSSTEKKINELESSLKEQFNELKKRVKEFTDKFIVEVPFDKEHEKLSFKIENGNIIVVTEKHTENSDSKIVTETSIPANVNVDRMIQRYDEKEKKMRFIFFKEVKNVLKTKKLYREVDSSKDINNVSKETDTNNEKVSKKEKLIKKILEMHENGFSYKKISEETGVSDKTIKRWILSSLKED